MDPIADMIIRMKNASRAGHAHAVIPHSRLRLAVAEKLKAIGFLSQVEKPSKKQGRTFSVELALNEDGETRLTDVRRLSKPGCRVYVKARDITPVRGGQGALLLSTPKGIVTGAEAREAHMGGEALFEIW